MTIHLEIPEDVAAGLARIARSCGQSPEQVALAAIRRHVSPFAEHDRLMAPTYAAMQAGGIDEDDAVDAFEAEKHAMRRERRASGQ
jgi:hypothetical protein